MDLRQDSIIKFSNEILDYLLKFKEVNPGFTFSLRQRDSAQTKEVKRLESGQWFQGSNYIYVPLFKKGDNARKIKTIGFSIDFDNLGNIKKNFIEISFKAGIVDENEISFHRQLASKIGLELNENNHGEKLFENPQDIISNLNFFITEVRNHALTLLDELGLMEKYIISEADFQKNLGRIEQITLNRVNENSQINYWLLALWDEHHDYKSILNNSNIFDWGLRSMGDKNPKKGDFFLLFNSKKFTSYGYGFFTSNPEKAKQGETVILGRSSKSDKYIEHPKIDIQLKIFSEVNLSGFKEEIINLGKFNSHKQISSNFYEILISKFNNRLMKDNLLNQILYGPPGTGKTYNTINKAIEIINPNFNLKLERKVIKAEYDSLEKEGKILFSTFHQSMSYEDFIEGIKPLSPVPNEALNYDIQAGIFKIACARAAYLCYKKYNQVKGITSSNYTFDELYVSFIEFIKPLIENHQFPIYKTITGKDVEIYEVNSQNSIKARAMGSIATHVAPLTQENLEKLYNKFKNISEINSLDQIRETVQVSPRITEFYAVFGGLKEFEKSYKSDNIIVEEEVIIDTTDDSEKVKKFTAGIYNDAIKEYGKESESVVLIIDEINRGNVSAIFGELITLIEADKRIGAINELKVKLPYSKKEFGVPPNLYIIGTMNTADRSVEALDTALRRRFSFVEMMPDSKIITEKNFKDSDRRTSIMNLINQRVEVLLDRNYTLGHSYFIKDDFKNSFENEIIPLLQEYFYNDYGKIGLVLGKGFVREKEITKNNNKNIFADFDTKNELDILKSYELIPFVEINFDEALEILLA